MRFITVVHDHMIEITLGIALFIFLTQQCRDVKPGLAEVTFQLTIDANILKRSVPYKYVIFSPKTKGDKDMPIEFIPNAGHQRDPNRALCISSKTWEQCCGG